MGLDGIMLDARHAGLEGPLTFTLEQVDPAALGLPPLPVWFPQVTDFYRIGHADNFVTREGPMIIGLPLPDGAPAENLGVELFAPAGAGLHGHTPAQWLTRGASYVPSIDRVAFANSFFPSDGS